MFIFFSSVSPFSVFDELILYWFKDNSYFFLKNKACKSVSILKSTKKSQDYEGIFLWETTNQKDPCPPTNDLYPGGD